MSSIEQYDTIIKMTGPLSFCALRHRFMQECLDALPPGSKEGNTVIYQNALDDLQRAIDRVKAVQDDLVGFHNDAREKGTAQEQEIMRQVNDILGG